MNRRDLFFSAALLLLSGILIGLLITMFTPSDRAGDRSEVRVTEINRSSQPFFSPEELEVIDSRFLFQKIASDVTPTVVYIETTVEMGGDREVDEDGERELWNRFLPRRARTVGSGVILSEEGYILTNNHVVEAAVGDGIYVTLSDKRLYPARIVGTDPSTDLAVIRIDAENLTPALMGDSDGVTVGEWVLAIGNPFRLRSTVTAGIVSALSRDVQIINDAMRIESFIQTDAAINRGNSGGALVNTSGELIGINTAIATQSGSYQGYGFAVPSNLALKVAGDLIEFGELRRGMLGVTIESVTHAIARDLNMDQIRGVLIVNTPSEGAAWEAGVRRNDVILEVNGTEVNEANQLQEKIVLQRPGDLVELTLWRDGEIILKEVQLRELELPEEPEPEESEFPQQLPDDIPEHYFEEGPDSEGETLWFDSGFELLERDGALIVRDVTRGSHAWNRGMRPGYQVLEVDGESVDRVQDAFEKLERARSYGGMVRLLIETTEGAVAHLILE